MIKMIKELTKSVKNLKDEVKEIKKRSFNKMEKTQNQNACLPQYSPQVSYPYSYPSYNGVFSHFPVFSGSQFSNFPSNT
jgi:hypothetical protein